jgi:hypothetical protein
MWTFSIPFQNRDAWIIRRVGRIHARAALTALLLMVAPLRPVHAHEEAQWIWAMHPQCCGPRDCVAVSDGGVARVNGGYLVRETSEMIPDRDALSSIDEHYWRCRYSTGSRAGETRCLFVPALGF